MSNCLITINNQPTALQQQLSTEKQLIRATSQDQQARVYIWRANNTLVVSKPESRLPGFRYAQNRLNQSGWPVVVRETGGAAVPQSPETLNLSLIYPAPASHYDIDASYQQLCKPIIEALSSFGIAATATAVAGSFCDGKYNLAVQHQNKIKKIVGTSQKWTANKVVLAHAVILTAIDTEAATKRINTFYRLAGSQEQKQADTVTSVINCLSGTKAGISSEQLTTKLSDKLAQTCASLTFST